MLQNVTVAHVAVMMLQHARFHYTNVQLNKPFNFAPNMKYIMYKHSIYRISVKIIIQM